MAGLLAHPYTAAAALSLVLVVVFAINLTDASTKLRR
jgi:hypothetical protein